MLIRYHMWFYAIGCLLLVLAQYFHTLFYGIFILYIIWLYFRLSFKHVIFLFVIGIVMFIPQDFQQLPHIIEGEIVKVGEKYCYIKSQIGMVKLYHEEQFHYKDYVKCSIQPLEMNENTNDHAFNEKLYLYGQKVFYKAHLETVISHQSQFSFYHWIESRLSQNQDVQDYQRLFLLGERENSIQEDYQHLSQLSLVHLFALSGMHIHILYHLLNRILGLFLKEKMSRYLSYISIGIYVFSIPMQISLYRAFFVMVLYELLKRWLNQLDVLSILVIVSLIYNPYIIYNISFVFSYFIYFVVLITKDLKYSQFLIYFSSIPFVLNLNYQVPLLAFFTGLIFNPFIEIFYSLCCLSVFSSIFEIILIYFVRVLKIMISFLTTFPFFIVLSKPSFAFFTFFYVILGWIILRLSLHQSIQKGVSMMIALFLSFSFYSQYKIYGEVTMIDVGQGDCTLIRLPMNQGNILIDTGGNRDYDLATQTIIPYLRSIGITCLDYVYISHHDFDHSGALESLVEHFDVKQVIDRFEDFRQIGCMSVTMLKANEYFDTNDRSLIMKVDLPAFSILFMGDASTIVEQDLKDKYKELDIDILKVGHHGSQTSTSVDLLEMIHPSIAMIGVKKNNIYHHPSNTVIERLNRKGIMILRTDLDGMFHIRFYGKSRYIFR